MIDIHNSCHSVGVPLRFVVNEVIASACAVKRYISTLSVLIVGVACEVVLQVLFVMRLFVSVTASEGSNSILSYTAFLLGAFVVSAFHQAQ